MNRRQLLGGATAGSAAVAIGSGFENSVLVGDGRADDAPAIQAALDTIGRTGGGTLRLPRPRVHYRLARGLKLPSHVVLEGDAPVQYPFNAGNVGACALIADFADFRQWVIEPATTVSGQAVAHDALIDGTLPDGVTYNCGVRNLLISSRGSVPYGGIRFHGCPGSVLAGVSIDRVGCGLLVNYCFGGSYQTHVSTLYYGIAAWDGVNANQFTVYASHRDPWPKTVPPAYRLPPIAAMRDRFVDAWRFSDNGYLDRPHGLICGSTRSTSVGNTFDAVLENYAQGVLLSNAYATDFRQCYLEAGPETMICGISATRSRFSIQGLHAFLSGTGALFDFGVDVHASIRAGGILHGKTFGKAPDDDGTSLLVLDGIEPTMTGAPMQRGIRYAARDGAWEPLTLRSSWRSATADTVAQVRLDPWSHRVELRGTIEGGADGVCFALPLSCRPDRPGRYRAAGGLIGIAADGEARIAQSESMVSLDGISFSRW